MSAANRLFFALLTAASILGWEGRVFAHITIINEDGEVVQVPGPGTGGAAPGVSAGGPLRQAAPVGIDNNPGPLSGGPSAPEIVRGPDPRENARRLLEAFYRMLAAVDPDLKTPSGKRPSIYSRTKKERNRLSNADDVIIAIDVVGRLEIEMGQIAGGTSAAAMGGDSATPGQKTVSYPPVTDEEVERATAALWQAVHDLEDDVPPEVAREVLRDPRHTKFLWLFLIALLIVALAVGYHQRQRLVKALTGKKPQERPLAGSRRGSR